MEAFLYLIYSNNIALIVFSAFVAYLLSVAIYSFGKSNKIIMALFPSPNSAIFPLGFIIYFTILFLPLPSTLDKQIIKMLDQLELNQVDSNGTINSVLMPCINKDMNAVRGFQYDDVMDAFQRDMDSHLEESSSYSGGHSKNMFTSDDLCKAAWHYNDIKLKRNGLK